MNTKITPKAGSKWFRPCAWMMGEYGLLPVSGRESDETRTVTDRTKNGVIFFRGKRIRRYQLHVGCTLAKWQEWAKDARQVSE